MVVLLLFNLILMVANLELTLRCEKWKFGMFPSSAIPLPVK